MCIADTNADIFELTEKPPLHSGCHWAFPIRLVGSAEELSCSLGFSAKSSSCVVIYKCNIHVPSLPSKENMCQYQNDTSVCCCEPKPVSKGYISSFRKPFWFDPIFRTDSSIPSYSSQITWSPKFFLRGINVHRKVGRKPDITRIFIKCNNWTLC